MRVEGNRDFQMYGVISNYDLLEFSCHLYHSQNPKVRQLGMASRRAVSETLN